MSATMKPLLLVLSLATALGAQAQELRFGPSTQGAPGAEHRLDSVVAVVEDDVITRAELDQAVRSATAQLRARGGQLPPPNVIERQVLERQILLKLEEGAAKRSGITVDDLALNATIENIAKRNNVSLDALRRSVEREGFSFERYREEIRREMLSARLRQKFVDSTIQISDQEVDLAMGHGSITSAAAAAGERRELHLAQILVAVPENAAPERVEQAKAKAETILAELRRGGDFHQLAAAVSDAQNALDGGDLGWRPSEQIPSALSGVVQALSPGQISEPIRTPSGFVLIKLIEARNAGGTTASGPQADEQKRNEVREALFRRKVEEEWDLWLKRLRDEAYVEIRL